MESFCEGNSEFRTVEAGGGQNSSFQHGDLDPCGYIFHEKVTIWAVLLRFDDDWWCLPVRGHESFCRWWAKQNCQISKLSEKFRQNVWDSADTPVFGPRGYKWFNQLRSTDGSRLVCLLRRKLMLSGMSTRVCLWAEQSFKIWWNMLALQWGICSAVASGIQI